MILQTARIEARIVPEIIFFVRGLGGCVSISNLDGMSHGDEEPLDVSLRPQCEGIWIRYCATKLLKKSLSGRRISPQLTIQGK